MSSALEELRGAQTTMPDADGPEAVPGKKVAIVSFTLAEQAAQRIVGSMEEAADSLGWTTDIYDGQANPSTANERIRQAVSTSPDAIVIVALDAALIQGSLKAAADAGIPVACHTCADLDDPDGLGPFVSISPSVKAFEDMGYAVAQWAYEYTDGSPRYLSLNDASLSNLSAREKGLERFLDECEAASAGCELLAHRPFLVADLNTKLSTQAADLARANPTFNTMWVSFDYAAQQVIGGLRQAGIATPDADSFAVASNGDAATLDEIAKDGYQKVTVGISFEWASYATMDNLNRLFAGQDPVDQYVPIRLFDKSNVTEAQDGAWAGDVDFRKAYQGAWSGE